MKAGFTDQSSSSIAQKLIALLERRSEPRSEAMDRWRSGNRWLAKCCVKSDRLFSAIGDLHIDFCAWLAKQGREGCTRAQFESLLRGHGYRLADGVASGLMLYAEVHGGIYEQLERLAIEAESGVFSEQAQASPGGLQDGVSHELSHRAARR